MLKSPFTPFHSGCNDSFLNVNFRVWDNYIRYTGRFAGLGRFSTLKGNSETIGHQNPNKSFLPYGRLFDLMYIYHETNATFL